MCEKPAKNGQKQTRLTRAMRFKHSVHESIGRSSHVILVEYAGTQIVSAHDQKAFFLVLAVHVALDLAGPNRIEGRETDKEILKDRADHLEVCIYSVW